MNDRLGSEINPTNPGPAVPSLIVGELMLSHHPS